MKVLSAEQIREADAYTIKHEPIKSIDLMERAATRCFEWLVDRFDSSTVYNIFCGVGNNGGDGLVIARLLHEKGFEVNVYAVRFSEKCSADFRVNETRLKKAGVKVKNITDTIKFPVLKPDTVIIDAIFGSGLARPIDGFVGNLVKYINQSECTTIAIDIPSGLFAEDNTDNIPDHIILADYTLTFEVAKLAFFFPENGLKIGAWHILDIGLDKGFIADAVSDVQLLSQNHFQSVLKERYKHAHKGDFGHALMITGSYGKMGASILTVEACLRAGAGLVSAFIPMCGYSILQTAVPEAMVMTSETEQHLSGVVDFGLYNAIGIGPGIGTDQSVANTLKQLIQNTSIPLVLDADALNILGDHKTWLAFLPKGSVLTPHPKEFERVFGKTNNSYQRLLLQREQAVKQGVYIVLKGAYSSIACPDGEIYFNTSGNPGMATAGSGDVLTGIITGLLAQGYDSKQAATLGVYIHGASGDLAADINGEESMLARDIIYNLGEAYKQLKNG